MTDIEKKALALLNEAWAERNGAAPLDRFSRDKFAINEALCRAIEQHEAFRQEVSDEVKAALACGDAERLRREGILSRFIIAKPDPLEEALRDAACDLSTDDFAEALRAAIAKHGGKIVWGASDD